MEENRQTPPDVLKDSFAAPSQGQPSEPGVKPPQVPPQADIPDYVVDTVTDGRGIRAAMDILLPPLFRVGYWVLGILCLVMGGLLIPLDGRLTLLSGACLFLGVFILLLRLRLPHRTAEKQLKVLRESYGTDSVPVHLVFWPQGVVVNNTISGAHVNIRYEIVRQLICREGYLVLRTQAGQSVILPLADVADRPDFLPYLVAKCPQAKKKGL